VSTGRQRPTGSAPSEHASPSSTGQGTVIGSEPAVRPIAPVGLQQMRDAWSQVLEHVQHAKRSAWTVVVTAQVTALRDDVLTLTFPSQQDVASFKEMADPTTSVSELVRAAILDVLGFRVKFVARGPGGAGGQGGAGGPGQQRPAESPRDQPAVTAQRPAQSQPAQAAPTSAPTAAPVTPAPAASAPAPAAPTTPVAQAQEQPAQGQPAEEQPAQRQPSAQQTARQQPESAPADQPTPAAEPTPAAQPTPVSNDPVTEWAVATIPSTDPSTGAVPEGVEPAWGAPFGSTGPSDTVAPTTPTPPDAAAPSRAGSPTRTDSSTSPDRQDGQRASVASPSPAATGSDVPVDDYPMDDGPFDDGPYDDGAPFPDPGFGGRAAGPAPTQPAPTQPAPTLAQQAPARQASAQSAPAQQRPARQAPAQQQPRRAPVPGRYGEAVVREILGAQFIEETTLSEGN
jgi:DNA polymerase-3 subunit gamma/tau